MQVDKQRFISEITDIGFTKQDSVFPAEMIKELNDYADSLKPERGHDMNQKWHGWNEVEKLEDPFSVNWAYYWSAHAEHPHIETIKQTLEPLADAAFGKDNWIWYVQDFITTMPGMNFYRPHIDTPYRFKEFRYADNLLGLQFAISMCDFTEWSGATGYVPGSHKYIYDGIHMRDKQESWKIFFADNYKQFNAPAGSFVCWHPRLIHSTMPNKTKEPRRALLIHAAERITARRLDVIDPQINSVLRTT